MPRFSGKMGYQGLVLEAILKGCIVTETRHVNNASGYNVASDGMD